MAMLVGDEGSPGQAFNTSGVTYSRNSSPWDDGRYRSGDDWEAARLAYEQGKPIPITKTNGRPLHMKWIVPTTTDEVKNLYSQLRASEETTKLNAGLFNFLYHLYKGAKKNSIVQRSDVDKEFIAQHYTPASMLEKFSGYYGTYITANPIILLVPAIDSFKGDISNLTLHSLCEFLHLQCMEPIILDDCVLFSLLWLMDSTPSPDAHNDYERSQLHSRLLPLLQTQSIPASLDDNVYRSNGTIEVKPAASILISDITGTATAPANSFPNPSPPTSTTPGTATVPIATTLDSGNVLTPSNDDQDTTMSEAANSAPSASNEA
ncbi:hypothetical protein L218DRAFT_1082475 [Marasmius fiardii PR-910]|nr:hypothetical protein L218DRAFT_1082475 [Marasmius fiardii PR-910]